MEPSRRAAARGMTPVEVAITVAVAGSLLAVAIPVFLRELHGSRWTEAVDGLNRIGVAAVAYAQSPTRPSADPFPPAAPLTPAVVPAGRPVVDPPGTWDAPTWKALAFEPSAGGAPHSFSFAFDRPASAGSSAATGLPSGAAAGAAPSTFVARASGDLDGDGTTSLFEIHGSAKDGAARVEPGMIVESELE